VNGVEGLHEELEPEEDAALLIDSLAAKEGTRLYRLLAEARAVEAADVSTAVDAMVAAIPPVVRGRVRKVLHRGDR
jgi:hypothetical protein